jgi:predicted O-methyltransferase YrrM
MKKITINLINYSSLGLKRRIRLIKNLYAVDVLFSYIKSYKELSKLNILNIISQKQHSFTKNVTGNTYRGQEYSFGGLGLEESKFLYALIRSRKPEIVLETGVCNGVSSTIILQALHENQKGKLVSVDFPEVEGMVYSEGTFWAGKGGAAIPKDKEPGWIIPEHLRYRWEVHLGKSQEILPSIVNQLSKIDIFIHDSEHSYECMMFEYETVYPKLIKKGILISDDVNWNTAFKEFSERYKLKDYYFSNNVGYIIKR